MRRRDFVGASAAALSLSACDAPPAIDGGFVGNDLARGHAWRDGAVAPAQPAETRRVHTVIAGGGVAGLAAARALRLAGIDDFVLLEMQDQAGGNARGGQVHGIACPLGAHYLPLPGDEASEVQDLLEELGLRQRVAGRWQYDERHLCHSPQERLYFRGQWQEGLLPVNEVNATTLAQYQRFGQRVEQLRQRARFAVPMAKVPLAPAHRELDAITLEAWLNQEGLDDPQLHWYLDYCCRDDYGASSRHVSAWAGIHYFASRHGFDAPGTAPDPQRESGLLTWPEGNSWITQRLAAPLGERLRVAHAVTRIEPNRHGVQVDAWDAGGRRLLRWQAQRCIVALPVFVAVRVVQNPSERLRQAAAHIQYAPWLVANVHLSAPLQDHPGAAPSWDNVIYGSAGLGYVDARHQSLDPSPRPTVLSWYRPLGPSRWDGATPGEGRARLLQQPWSHWRDALLAELSVPHPDLPRLATRIDISRWGHAMAIPTPGLLSQIGTQRLSGGRLKLSIKEQLRIDDGRLSYAHADWSGYSVFEEAFTRGHWAGVGQI